MNSQNNPEIQEQPKKKPLDFLYNRKWKKAVIIALAILLCLALIVAGTFGFMWISGRNALLDQGNQYCECSRSTHGISTEECHPSEIGNGREG